jgi:undecaprenyl-diphosphatase
MQWWQAILLSIVEGITEFLPISSTGHMILVSHLLGVENSEFVKSFEIIVQLGAILAVFLMYVRKLWEKKEWWGNLIVAFGTTGVFGVVLYKIVKTYLLGNPTVVVWSLLIGGVALIVIERIIGRKSNQEGKAIEQICYPKAVLVGLAQAVSMIPGVSRSAATIFGGMGVGMSREAAVEFSFLLAVPTMAAATGLDLLKVGMNFSSNEYLLLGVGLLGSFITAWIVVKAFLRYVKSNSFEIFGWYRIAVAVLYIIFVK